MSIANRFEESLPGNVDSRRASPTDLVEVLEEVCTEPVVGVSLGFSEVSLEDSDIEVDPSPREILEAGTGVTPAGLGVVGYGSFTLKSRGVAELVGLYPNHHVAVLRTEDIVDDMEDAFQRLEMDFKEGEDTQILISGPSATADMGTLVHGVHGPEEVTIVLLEVEA